MLNENMWAEHLPCDFFTDSTHGKSPFIMEVLYLFTFSGYLMQLQDFAVL